ncbi:IS21 family transposase [candidate division KSB1 bacterium]
MYKEGRRFKEIARNLNISKNTVKTYIAKLLSLQCDIDDLLALDDPILEARFHAGNPAYKDNERYDALKTSLEHYKKELDKVGVTRKLLWEEYKSDQPEGYSYTQFCFHMSQQAIAQRRSMVLSHKPAEKLFIDFAGKKMSYINKSTGEIIQCPVFVACLPYSDYCFAMAVRSQCIEDFIFALKSCLEFLGGVPEIIVSDNLKSAVVKANNYEPDINRALEDFCNHYKTVAVPTRVKKPKDKALVENQVKLVYMRVFAKLRNETFFSISEMNKSILEKVVCHNQTRMQIKPYCREEKFLSDEKHLLSPLPEESYEIKYYRQYKVMPNNHILLYPEKHYYSVHYKWIGEQAKVIFTRTLVRIFVKGELVAVHQRNFTPGGYTTIKEHLCSYHNHYLSRSPEYYRQKAKEKSELLFRIVDKLFNGGRPPEQNYKSCDGLFNLHKKTDPKIFEKACEIALECGNSSYRYVLGTIENLKKMPDVQKKEEPRPLPSHSNIRGKDYYIQTTLNFKK